MVTATSDIPALAKWVLLREVNTNTTPDAYLQAAFHVCDKLGRSILTFAGTAGYRSLLSRALALARSQVSWLAAVQIKTDGSLELRSGVATELSADSTMQGGMALVESLLKLLATLIGEALTLRLVRDVWQDVPVHGVAAEREEHL